MALPSLRARCSPALQSMALLAGLGLAISPAARAKPLEFPRRPEPIAGGALAPGRAGLALDDELFRPDGAPLPRTWESTFALSSSRAIATLSIQPHGAEPLRRALRAHLRLRVEARSATGAAAVDRVVALSVDYHPDGTRLYRSADRFVSEGAQFLRVTVERLSLQDEAGAEIRDPALAGRLSLETRIAEERTYRPDPSAAPTPRAPVVDLVRGEVRLQWSEVPWAERYDLEWTYVDDYLATGPAARRDLARIAFDFRFQGTRVPVTGTSYALPALYERGWLLWRVRAVGRAGARAEQAEQPVAGAWAPIAADRGTVAGAPPGSAVELPAHDLVPTLGETTLGWQHEATFAEEGKRRDVVRYLDGTLRTRQTVSKRNTDNLLVVGETIRDHRGRPAVEVLPSPVTKEAERLSGRLGFQRGFNLNPEGEPYSYRDFELRAPGSPAGAPPRSRPMDSARNGAAKYYSPHNPDQRGHQAYVPDAAAFPFGRRTYEPDETHRLRALGAPGPDHQIGSGHEQRFFYGVPAQDELDRLFGNDVGLAQHYRKQLSVDPDGQAAVKYLDPAGRVIVTALAGGSPESLLPLEGATGTPTEIDLLESGTQLVPGGRELRSSKTLLVSADGTEVRFRYRFTPPDVNEATCPRSPLCLDCVYALHIQIVDGEGREVESRRETIGSLRDLGTCGPGDGRPVDLTFTRRLARGSYRVIKRLVMDEAAIDQYVEHAREQNACLPETRERIRVRLGRDLDPARCGSACARCDLRTTRYEGFRVRGGGERTLALEVEERSESTAACSRACGADPVATPCEAGFQAMLADVSPGGQYAGYGSAAEPRPEAFALSVLNHTAANRLPILDANWKHPVGRYRDADGRPSRIPIPGGDEAFCLSPDSGTCKPQDLNRLADFLRHWRASWAEALVPYHPEYGYHRWCRERDSEEMLRFAERLRGVDTLEQARASERFDPAPAAARPLPRDPLPEALLRETRSVQTRCGEPAERDLVELVHLTVGCNNPNFSGEEALACARGLAARPLGADTELANYEWRVFRDLYLSERTSVLHRERERWAAARFFTNRCIEGDPGSCAAPMDHRDYAGQRRRFRHTEDALDELPACELRGDWVDREMYRRCGKCPRQLDLETFLSSAASSGRLTRTFDLPRFPVVPTREVLDGFPDRTARSYRWTGEARGEELAVTIRSGGADQCRISLHRRSPVPWEDLRWIGGLGPLAGPRHFPRSPGRNFEATGHLADGRTVELEGAITCLDLSDCTLPRLCEARDTLAEEVEQLVRQVTAGGRYLSPVRPVLVHERGSAASVLGPELRRFSPDADRYFWAFMRWGAGPAPETDRSSFTAELRAGAPDTEFATRCALTFRMNRGGFEEPGLSIRGVRRAYRTLGEGSACTTRHIELDARARNGESRVITIASACHVMGECCVAPACSAASVPLPFPRAEPGAPGLPPGTTPGLDPRAIAPRRLAGLPTCDRCDFPPTPRWPYRNPCADQQREALTVSVEAEVGEALAGLERSLRERYRDGCLVGVAGSRPPLESFVASYEDRIYHVTLFYFDQAGNLVRTVPPKGVAPLGRAQIARVQASRAGTGAPVFPRHSLDSSYRYNTLNELTRKALPDSGATSAWYDRLGRPVASQDVRQRAEGRRFTYLVYDALGRVIETGEVAAGADLAAEVARDERRRAAWLAGGTRTERTVTQYDAPASAEVSALFEGGQQNLRKRVASRLHEESAPDGTVFRHRTHFSYDLDGNVKDLVQENPQMPAGHRVKKVTYQYDVVSRTLRRMTYQPGQPDQFIHRYSYDADGRMVLVETSTDGIGWDRDARYHYYQHGPLARLELGEERVQGVDYAYTIHGWLKGINSDSLSPARDIGRDGPGDVPADVFGLSVGYYRGDYRPIGSLAAGQRFAADTSSGPLDGPSLFGGNISHLVTALAGLAPEQRIQASKYRYDQLGRLRSARAVRGLDEATNSWASAREIPDYSEDYTYDPNGNILTVTRNGAGAGPIDDLAYHYREPGTNRLSDVSDAAGTRGPDLPNQAPRNYAYDPAGRLTRDRAAGIRAIRWTAASKLARIESNGGAIAFGYDAAGNRAMKRSAGSTTWYVRDAGGRILAIYFQRGADLEWESSPIHGFGRLGSFLPRWRLAGGEGAPLLERGKKRYELAGQAGNVLAVVSDRQAAPAPGDSGGGYAAALVEARDYYAYGMGMPGRAAEATGYRYGFQGMERDHEPAGYTTPFRQYDPRIGRWWSVDPMRNPSEASYVAFGSNPISLTDAPGLQPQIALDWGLRVGGNFLAGGYGEIYLRYQLWPPRGMVVNLGAGGSLASNATASAVGFWRLHDANRQAVWFSGEGGEGPVIGAGLAFDESAPLPESPLDLLPAGAEVSAGGGLGVLPFTAYAASTDASTGTTVMDVGEFFFGPPSTRARREYLISGSGAHSVDRGWAHYGPEFVGPPYVPQHPSSSPDPVPVTCGTESPAMCLSGASPQAEPSQPESVDPVSLVRATGESPRGQASTARRSATNTPATEERPYSFDPSLWVSE